MLKIVLMMKNLQSDDGDRAGGNDRNAVYYLEARCSRNDLLRPLIVRCFSIYLDTTRNYKLLILKLINYLFM